jgi:hypothetical protein
VTLRSLRWLILGVFVNGLFHGVAGPPWLQLIALAACALLLSRLQAVRPDNVWAWVVLAVFVDGYFVKGDFLAAHLPVAYKYVADLGWVTEARIAQAGTWISATFISFAVTAWFVLGRMPRTLPRRAIDEPGARSDRAVVVVVVASTGYAIATIIQAKLGFGILGTAGPPSSLLATAITRFRSDLFPALLVLSLWVFNQRRSRWAVATLAVALAAGLAQSFLSTSRGGLVQLMMPIVLLWVLTTGLTLRRTIFAAGALAAVVAAFPAITAIREAIRTGWSRAAAGPAAAAWSDTLLRVLFRVQGAEGAWLALPAAPGVISMSRAWQTLVHGNSVYYTRVVVREFVAGDFRAPGLVGGLMLIGSLPAVMAMMAVLVAISASVFGRLARWETGPVACAVFGAAFMGFCTDGTFAVRGLIAALLAAWTADLIYRRWLRSPPEPSTTSPTTSASRALRTS